MNILGDRKFVELPGNRKHELPPLLVKMSAEIRRLDRIMSMANEVIEEEDMIPDPLDSLPEDVEPGPPRLEFSETERAQLEHNQSERAQLEMERRKMDLALNLIDQYLAFVQHWQWGDSILEWIRQCQTTFETRPDLRPLLRADVWPHAGRSSFVTLLEDKDVETGGVTIEKAVGMRLTFRQPPPLKCFSNQFLLYLNSPVANTAYQTWAGMTPSPISSFPPERFMFQVVNMSLD